jgi:cytochrome b558/566 subunit A
VLVKSANDGYNMYMLFRWNDTQGPSYLGDTEVYKAANGSLIPLNPALTANVTALYYNSTYYYPDRVAMLWFVANQSQMQLAPKMMLGSNGALTGGAAEIWHWQTNPTDNNPNDTGFPGGYTDPLGNPIYPPDNLSFAEDDYTNTTGFFTIGGSFGNSTPNLDPYADPFIVHVGSYYSYSNKTWTVEMVRSFTANDPQYRVQLATGSFYYVAFGVWQGKLGESSDFKSTSQWYNITISGQSISPPTPTPSSTGGISITLAAAVGIGALIAGLIIGTLVRSSVPSAPQKKTEGA